MSKKIRVAVLYGGRSGEHEVSLRSAASVAKNLDSSKFEAVLIGIDKDGKWHLGGQMAINHEGHPILSIGSNEKNLSQTSLLLPFPSSSSSTHLLNLGAKDQGPAIDVVFPVLHGSNGEDGTVQGFMELAEIPYVGCGVLSSAIGMDKEVAKRLAQSAGVEVAPYISLKKDYTSAKLPALKNQIEKQWGYPVFVKPVNMGSSVGVHKVSSEKDLSKTIEDAFRYDTKVLIEKGIKGREIEFAVLENEDPSKPPIVSVAGEVVASHDFYSYEAKYLDENGAKLIIPAPLTPAQLAQGQQIAREVFLALECEGMARVDMFLEESTGKFILNEINTIPGFTSISMYPKMLEASGIPYSELLTRLIRLAILRHERKSKLVRDFTKG